MITDTIDLKGIGAAYLRVSDAKQDETRQRKDIGEFLTRFSGRIRNENYFVDKDWTRDEAEQRPDFNRLLRLAESGRVNWIVVSEDDRFGTKNQRQLQHYLYLLNEANCRLYNATGKELTSDDFGSFLESAVKGNQSEASLRSTATRVHSAMRDRAQRGEWGGGHIPYGFDVVCYVNNDLTRERWRVQMVGRNLRVKVSADGSRKDYNGVDNFPAREKGETLQLRPTTGDVRQRELINKIFATFDGEQVNYSQLAKLASESGLAPYYAEFWHYKHIERMLKNPVYTGYPTWNKNSYAKYVSWSNGRQIERKPGQKALVNAITDWIKPDAPLFPPVVEPKLFQRVQQKIADIETTHHKSRAPRNPKLWLRGILYCGNCGLPMHGRTESVSGRATYTCSTYVNHHGPRADCKCGFNCVDHQWAERQLKSYLDDVAPAVKEIAKPRAPAALKEAIKAGILSWQKMRRQVLEKYGPDAMEQVRNDHQEEDMGRLYRSIFESAAERDTGKLDQLRAEFREQTLSLAAQKTAMRRAVVEARLDELEGEINDLDNRTTDHAAAYAQALAEAESLGSAWEAAKIEIDTISSGRRKAEALKKVVGKMVVSFKIIGKKRVIERFEVIPASNVSQQTAGCRESLTNLLRSLLSRSYLVADFGADARAQRLERRRANGSASSNPKSLEARARYAKWYAANRNYAMRYARKYRAQNKSKIAAYRAARRKGGAK